MSMKVDMEPLNGKYSEEFISQYRKMHNAESAMMMKSAVYTRICVDVVTHIKLTRWMAWTHLQDDWIKNTKRNLRRKNVW
jgi:hypothetical protein